jgi:hypothetical protein
MKIKRIILLFWGLGLLFLRVSGQRSYVAVSVLASGNWYKVSISSAGIYKIDIPFLNALGINTTNLSSASIRLFGNGGQMLPENNAAPRIDDLKENAVFMADGGDGIFNGADYFLFYAAGPDLWEEDSVNQRFVHRKNLYADKSFYFLTIGGNGKRMGQSPVQSPPNLVINTFSERIFQELDTVNFLASGKEWYGEELSALPGRSLNRVFNRHIPDLQPGSTLVLRTECIARSAGSASRFDIAINGQPLAQLPIAAIGTGQYDLFARPGTVTGVTNALSGTLNISYTYVPGSFNAQGWINWFEIFARRNLSLFNNETLFFRDWSSVGNIIGEFIIKNATSTTRVWDITDPLNPLLMPGSFSGTEYSFINSCNRLREYVAFNNLNTAFKTPDVVGKVSTQNLHNSSPADLLIVVHPTMKSQADRLAQLHQQYDNLRTVVVTTEQVFNEFSSGSPDPVAIRDFVKMYYDKYRNSTADKLKYLLLFGDASFDYKDRLINNTNMVPAWQNNFSLDPLSTYCSDDFFGFLDDNEDINSGLVVNLLDIGIGRIPARNFQEAKNFTDKINAYLSPGGLGPWRNNLTFIADDEDNNLHLQDAELFTATTEAINQVFNKNKIYLDAYRQQTGAGGSSYPDANQASNNQVYNGTLIWNYTGHGGSSRLAEEVILDQSAVNGWSNENKLPLFITATCDFAPFDNPSINSLGENILLRPKTGAIALMTTTRLVFAFSNRIMNNNYLQVALQQDANGNYKTLGEAMMASKNLTYQTLGDIANNRKFTLMGDPALQLAFPRYNARITRINNLPANIADTLSALEKVLAEGEVTDNQGNLLVNFNGTIYPTIYDKPQTISTLANDPGSQVATFTTYTNVLFKGKATVNNGRFSFTFKMPKDINYQYGKGKISLYADNNITDANGLFSNIIIGGQSLSADPDKEGPEIRPYLNNELFVNGGLTNQNPVLIVKLADTSGINTAGTGIGHDIVATLDNDNNRFFVLNDFFQGELNSYQQGTVHFQLPQLSPGPHSLRIKSWDLVNNSSEVVLDFIVANDKEIELRHVLNYPNPFTTNTTFWFEHNQPGQVLQVSVQVLTITGKSIKSITKQILPIGNRSAEINWDGRDDFGDKLARGVYLYKIGISAPGKKQKSVMGKLMIL